jgi:hypothetical protein
MELEETRCKEHISSSYLFPQMACGFTKESPVLQLKQFKHNLNIRKCAIEEGVSDMLAIELRDDRSCYNLSANDQVCCIKISSISP